MIFPIDMSVYQRVPSGKKKYYQIFNYTKLSMRKYMLIKMENDVVLLLSLAIAMEAMENGHYVR